VVCIFSARKTDRQLFDPHGRQNSRMTSEIIVPYSRHLVKSPPSGHRQNWWGRWDNIPMII
jgi:hypothetical protein